MEQFLSEIRRLADEGDKAGIEKRPAMLRTVADMAEAGRVAGALAEAEDAPKRDSHATWTAQVLAACDGLRERLEMPSRVTVTAPVKAGKAQPVIVNVTPRGLTATPVTFTITAPRHHLLAALSVCAEIAPAKPTRAAMACVHIECGDKVITIRAAGENDAIERTVPADCSAPGAVMVDARGLKSRIGALDNDDVEMRVSASDVAIYQGGRKRYTVSLWDLGDAPRRVMAEPQGTEVDPNTFALLLARVQPSADINDDAKPAVKSIKLTGAGGYLTAMTTDGRTGAVGKMSFAGSIDSLVMSDDVTQIRKVCAQASGLVRVAMVGNSIHMFGDGFSYSTRTIDAAFPPIEAILPSHTGPMFSARRADFIKAVESIAVAGPDLGRLRFRPSANMIELNGCDKNGQTADASFAVDSTIASVSLGIEYVSKALAFVTEEEIEVYIDPGSRSTDGGAGPALFCGKGSKESFLVMPVKYDAQDLA